MISINDLPPELLVHIFSFCIELQGYRRFLKNIPLVCKRWSEVYLTPSLWEKASRPYVRNFIYEEGSDKVINEWSWEEMKKLGEKGLLSSARHLCLYECPYSENEMTQFIRCFHNLRTLLVLGTVMSREVMEILAEQCPNIQNLDFIPSDQQIEDALTPFLRVRGKNIKFLNLSLAPSLREMNWVSTIAENCSSLEIATFCEDDKSSASSCIQFPIYELIVGCPKLRELEISGFTIASEMRNHEGFSEIIEFSATDTDFGGVDFHSILKNSKTLEVLDLWDCRNVVWNRISWIPSESLEWFGIVDKNLDRYSLQFLKDVASRWKHTLTGLRIVGTQMDLNGVIEAYLHKNLDPKLNRLIFPRKSSLSTQVLGKLMGACKNLEFLYWKDT